MISDANHFLAAQRVKEILCKKATASFDPWEDAILCGHEYAKLRSQLVLDVEIKHILPEFLVECRNLDEFWQYIQPKFSKYAERRIFLNSSFSSLLDVLESRNIQIGITQIDTDILPRDAKQIRKSLEKCLNRKERDPDGALTSAHSLLEAAFKFILDKEGSSYDNSDDLPILYRKVVQIVQFSSSEEDKALLQILSGCKSIVQGVATFRNRFGDAHGKSESNDLANINQANLAVSISCAVVEFLLTSWENGKKRTLEDIIAA
jgi:Abortive infection C-terminus